MRDLKSKMFDIREYEASYIIGKLVGGKSEILNVGCSWGRDNFYLKSIGKEVFNVDKAKQKIENFVLCDVSKGIPFKDKTFDAVLLADVLEHIYEDFYVLQETRRVLKDGGVLILSVPFFHDEPEYHVSALASSILIVVIRYMARCGSCKRVIGFYSFDRVDATYDFRCPKCERKFDKKRKARGGG
ncbi:hypothetical protein ES706_06509 [subsurface metagenome]